MIYYIIIGVILLVLIYTFAVYNSFVKLTNKTNEAFSTMDVYLKKRWDLIPNLIEIVKGYAKHEKDTLESVIKLRNNAYDDMSDSDKLKANEQIAKGINKIMLLSENYPELKADQNFRDLSSKLTKVEDDIANSRKYYNGTIRIFNNKVEMFPSNIFAKIFGYKSRKMFEANANERENIKIEF